MKRFRFTRPDSLNGFLSIWNFVGRVVISLFLLFGIYELTKFVVGGGGVIWFVLKATADPDSPVFLVLLTVVSIAAVIAIVLFTFFILAQVWGEIKDDSPQSDDELSPDERWEALREWQKTHQTKDGHGKHD